MAAKKAKTGGSSSPRSGPTRPKTTARAREEEREPTEALELIATALAGHDGAIRQLAEVTVNLHANIRAIRGLVEALAAKSTEPHIASARATLRRVKLDE
jgi:hypothetical protein